MDQIGFGGLRQADGRGRGLRGGGGDQSVLYSHSLNPLWNRSMKCHSPVQKEVRRKVMREDRAEVISAPTCDEVRVMVIFIHTVQHENIISITEHRDVV